jgi:hypothetical protein
MRAARKRRAYPAQTRFARLNAALAFGLERGGRAALLAGASTIAFAAFGSAAVWAACSNGNRPISSATTGPVLGDWDGNTPGVGNITVTGSGSVAGSPQGVFAENCGIDTLENMGSIFAFPDYPPGLAVAVQVNPGVTIRLLTNGTGATISGGPGEASFSGFGFPGGAGVANSGTISSLTNSGMVYGGAGGNGAGSFRLGGAGQAGIANSGTISSLSNSETVMGGVGGNAAGPFGGGGVGGAGIINLGTISSLSNSETVKGGVGGNAAGVLGAGGAGGAGINNYGTITSLTNSGDHRRRRGQRKSPRRSGRGPTQRDERDYRCSRQSGERHDRRHRQQGCDWRRCRKQDGPRKRRQDRHADQ